LLESALATCIKTVVSNAAGAITEGVSSVTVGGKLDAVIADVGKERQAVHFHGDAGKTGRVYCV
jgi:hypothetical protein